MTAVPRMPKVLHLGTLLPVSGSRDLWLLAIRAIVADSLAPLPSSARHRVNRQTLLPARQRSPGSRDTGRASFGGVWALPWAGLAESGCGRGCVTVCTGLQPARPPQPGAGATAGAPGRGPPRAAAPRSHTLVAKPGRLKGVSIRTRIKTPAQVWNGRACGARGEPTAGRAPRDLSAHPGGEARQR